jgi:peptidoglycan/LPS O-acetylase OafA/YrhL
MTTTTAPLSVLAGRPIEKKAGKVSRFYRPELDAIRFFLFLGVLFHHSVDNAGTQGWAKIPLLAPAMQMVHDASGFALSFFFFLSSYLITCLLQMEKKKTGTVCLKNFYIRRMLRLWPLYVGYLLLCCVLHFTNSHHYPLTPGAIASLLLFSGNWYMILHGDFPGVILFHLWSISVEEQFYVLFPFFAKRATTVQLQRACTAICVGSLGVTWVLVAHGTSVMHVWANSFVESIFFASGALFALRRPMDSPLKSGRRAGLGIAAGLVLWGLAQMGGLTNLSRALHPLSATLAIATADLGCICMLWGALYVPTRWLPKFLVYLGRIAFGLYVFHLLVIDLVRYTYSLHFHIPGSALVLELVLCILVATVSYEYFEKPFLKLKHHFEAIHSRTTEISATTAIPAVSLGVHQES